MEEIVAETLARDVQYQRPVHALLRGRVGILPELVGGISHHAHGEVLRREVLLPPLLHEARHGGGVVSGVVDVLVPEVLYIGVVPALVQEPIGPDVPYDHEVDVFASLDPRRVGLAGQDRALPPATDVGILPAYEVHEILPVDHRAHGPVGVVVPTPEETAGLLGEVLVDVVARSLADRSQQSWRGGEQRKNNRGPRSEG